MISHGKDIKVFTGNANPKLAEDICKLMGTKLGESEVGKFSDGEIFVSLYETVRGSDAFVVQSTCGEVNNNLMELLIMIDALKRASAGRITAVMPYYGYARQDRKAKARDPISAKLVANMLVAAGADRVLTMDLHAAQIQGFFDIPVDHIFGSNVLAPYVASLNLKKLIVASPDVGGSKRASNFAKKLHIMTDREVPMVICYKHRPEFNKVSEMRILGDIYGKDVVIFDDMVDTAGTLCKAAEIMKEGGAKSVRAVVSHAVLSGSACQRIEESVLEEVVCTDSLPIDPARCSKLHVVSLAKSIAATISAIQNHTPVSEANTQ